MKRIVLTALGVLLPLTANAGSFDAETGIYTSYLGYEIKPPKGWFYVDASNLRGMETSLPKNIAAKALERVDVVFFPDFTDDSNAMSKKADDERIVKNEEALKDDPKMSPEELLQPVLKLEATEIPKFSTSISILSVRAKIRETPEAPKAYEEAMVAAAKKNAIAGFKVVNSTYDDALVSGSAYVFSYEFQHKRTQTIHVDQTLLFHGEQTLVITCANDVEDYIKDKNWCKQVVNSIEFK